MSDDIRHPVDLDDEEETFDEQELAEARRFADALDALDHGGARLDDLPNVGADDPLPELIVMAHAVRGLGPAGSLSASRRDAVWGDLETRLDQASAAAGAGPARGRWPVWRSILMVFGAAAAVALAVVLVSQLLTPEATAPVETPPAPRAVASLEGEVPTYARQLLTTGEDPRGDTRLRDYREAHFEAWRTDATWSTRYRTPRATK